MNSSQTLAACEPAGPSAQDQANPATRILLVDDDGGLRQLVAEALAGSGYEVEEAANGAEAWGALSADWYDLMITDNHMPKVTGIELLKKLRAAQMALPVIMATGIFPADEFSRHPWLQPAATLVKPYLISELLGTVKEVLRAADCPPEQSAPKAASDLAESTKNRDGGNTP
jgi:DNA-binding response OmpR family regulator